MFKCLSDCQRLEAAFSIYRSALGSPFYKKKYESAAVPEDINSWRDLPILTRDEIYQNTFPRSRDMLTMPLENMIVVSTGGSSGTARYTVYTHEEWDLFCDTQSKVLKIFGIKPDDRVANLFIAGHMWPSFLGLHENIKRIKAVHLPISSNIPPQDIFDLCVEFDATVIISLPTLFIFMADMAQKSGKKIPSLRMLCYAGEQLSAEGEKHVRQALGVSEIRPAAYTSSDAGLMGYPCSHSATGTYHVPTDFQFIEIVNPDTLTPMNHGEKGSIVVTNLGRRSFPIIRYMIGDDGIILTEPCPCGDPNPRFKLMGRSGDDFKLGGGFISMNEFDKALSETESVFSLNYNVEITDVKNQVEIVFCVEAADVKKAESEKKKLFDSILSHIKEFRVGLELGYIKFFEVKVLELGMLPRNPRTGKIKRLIDRRVN
ncbi:MAG TPA: AMP-binding protein [Candidatus Wallbacteria bacterium]|nr:AMP-binding protein [Candidatus Wallbacteria bacterium]